MGCAVWTVMTLEGTCLLSFEGVVPSIDSATLLVVNSYEPSNLRCAIKIRTKITLCLF
jgi:hypothetical protein